MAHIPPNKGTIATRAITIVGESDSIGIVLPDFYLMKTSMSIELSGRGGITTITSTATKLPNENETTPIPTDRKFKSKIKSIELEKVRSGDPGEPGVLVFKPDNDGKCTIRIFFEHLD